VANTLTEIVQNLHLIGTDMDRGIQTLVRLGLFVFFAIEASWGILVPMRVVCFLLLRCIVCVLLLEGMRYPSRGIGDLRVSHRLVRMVCCRDDKLLRWPVCA